MTCLSYVFMPNAMNKAEQQKGFIDKDAIVASTKCHLNVVEGFVCS